MFEYKPQSLLLYYFAVILIFGLNTLAVNALKCHQCNSLLDAHCEDLKEFPKATNITNKYLRDCEQDHKNAGHELFCRKTTYFINYEESLRVIRSCGWLRDRSIHTNKPCINADNEGYQEMICVCDADGCNTASNKFSVYQIVTSISTVLICWFLK